MAPCLSIFMPSYSSSANNMPTPVVLDPSIIDDLLAILLANFTISDLPVSASPTSIRWDSFLYPSKSDPPNSARYRAFFSNSLPYILGQNESINFLTYSDSSVVANSLATFSSCWVNSTSAFSSKSWIDIVSITNVFSVSILAPFLGS